MGWEEPDSGVGAVVWLLAALFGLAVFTGLFMYAVSRLLVG